jgi:hypothetical protein
VTGACEHGSELSGYVEGTVFLEHISYYQLIKKNYLPWS